MRDRDRHAAGLDRRAGIERILDSVDAQDGKALAAGRRAERADRPPAGDDLRARRGQAASPETISTRRRAVPRCCMRDTTSWPT